jgi:hypothetical protein
VAGQFHDEHWLFLESSFLFFSELCLMGGKLSEGWSSAGVIPLPILLGIGKFYVAFYLDFHGIKA